MYNTTKVKTYTPVIPAGTGPTFTEIEDCILEMVCDLEANTHSTEREIMLDNDQKNMMVRLLINGLDIKDWIDGEYSIFPNYTLRIETMAQSRLDEMPEFDGY